MFYFVRFYSIIWLTNLLSNLVTSKERSTIWKNWDSFSRKIIDDYYKELCKQIRKEELAKVMIKLEGPTFIRYKRSLRVTFIGKLSSIGGTLGLFTGFSLLALLELIHWICMVCSSILSKMIKVRNSKEKDEKKHMGWEKTNLGGRVSNCTTNTI